MSFIHSQHLSKTTCVSCTFTNRFTPINDVPHPFENFYDYPDTAETVYQRIFDKSYPPKRYIWGAGKIVTVGKNLIRKRPKHFYENVLAFIMSPYNGEKPPLNIYRTRTLYMERFLLLFFKELIEK